MISFLVLFLALCLAVSAYNVHTVYSGADFQDPNKFDFETGQDPNGGAARYVSLAEANTYSLISVQTLGTNYYKTTLRSLTDPTDPTSRRRISLRLRTKDSQVHSRGLWVMEFSHMPEGCSTWPAFWLNSKWYQGKPNFLGGEIDVLEGVNNGNGRNSATLHTVAGCTMDSPNQVGGFTGSWKYGNNSQPAKNCDHAAANQYPNQGCGLEAPTGSFGPAVNTPSMNGGYYAVEVTDYFIKIFFFPRSSGYTWSSNPNPSTWSNAYLQARFDFGTNCPSGMFYDFNTILNTNFCGGWAGGDTFYRAASPTNGATGMCQPSNSNNPNGLNCEDWVAANQVFLNNNAFWDINSITYYN